MEVEIDVKLDICANSQSRSKYILSESLPHLRQHHVRSVASNLMETAEGVPIDLREMRGVLLHIKGHTYFFFVEFLFQSICNARGKTVRWKLKAGKGLNMSTTSNLPPLSSNGVFFVSASIIIDAPRDRIWDVLLDFPKYREWCVYLSFCH
jgi:hypothetical protein